MKNFILKGEYMPPPANETARPALKMIYTPKHHITLGQLVMTPEGELSLRVKKGAACEEVSLSKLLHIFAQAFNFIEGTH